jgi:hypothetical protein
LLNHAAVQLQLPSHAAVAKQCRAKQATAKPSSAKSQLLTLHLPLMHQSKAPAMQFHQLQYLLLTEL